MSQELPREYRIGGGGRRFLLGLGGFAVLIGLAGAAYSILNPAEVADRYLIFGLGLFFALLGAPVLATAIRTRVVLYPDALESRGIFVTRRMERTDIAGRRLISVGDGPMVIQLLPNTTRARELKLPQYLATDAEWQRWFESIPDVDAEERQAALDAYLVDPNLMGSNEERIADLESARRVARILTWASLAVGCWAWFYPRPYDLAIACVALLPLVTMALAVHGGAVYRINTGRNDVAADISLPLLLPGVVLMIRALFDLDILEWGRMLGALAIATAAGMLLLLTLFPELRKPGPGFLAATFFVAPYAYGAVALANTRFDRSEPVSHATKVIDARISTGQGTQYYLRLEPWGPRTKAEEVDVGPAMYGRAARGDTVCVHVHRGALGVRWFYVEDCSG